MKFKELLALSVVPVGLFAGSQDNNSYSAQHTMHTKDAHTNDMAAHAAMHEEPGVGLSVFGDYLYWKPYFSNLPYAIQYPYLQPAGQAFNNAQVDSNGVLNQKFVNNNFAFSGDSAFRIGANYQSDWQSFGLGVVWTSFSSSDTNRRSNSAVLTKGTADFRFGDAVVPWWDSEITVGEGLNSQNNLGTPFATRATTTIKLDFVDYAVNTQYSPVSWLKFHPSFAIRTMYSSMNFRQVTNRNRNTRSGNVAGAPPWVVATDNNNQKFNAVGLLGGVTTDFSLYEGFKLFSGAHFSYNAGHMKVTRSIDVSESAAGVAGHVLTSGSQKADQTMILPVSDFDVGLEYSWADDDNNFGLNMQVAYEMHLLPGYQNFVYQSASIVLTNFVPQAIRYTGDLTIQGLRLRAGIAF